jgi:hypothetical protein
VAACRGFPGLRKYPDLQDWPGSRAKTLQTGKWVATRDRA